MKVLLANKFFFVKGERERSFFGTADLLKAKRHEVPCYQIITKSILGLPLHYYVISDKK